MERRHPDDFEVVGAVLARQRRLGTSFDSAWALVLAAFDSPLPTVAARQDRDLTLTALRRTEEDWRLAYERRPPRPPQYSMAALDLTERAGVAA